MRKRFLQCSLQCFLAINCKVTVDTQGLECAMQQVTRFQVSRPNSSKPVVPPARAAMFTSTDSRAAQSHMTHAMGRSCHALFIILDSSWRAGYPRVAGCTSNIVAASVALSLRFCETLTRIRGWSVVPCVMPVLLTGCHTHSRCKTPTNVTLELRITFVLCAAARC